MTATRQKDLFEPARTRVRAPLISLASYASLRLLTSAEVLGMIEQDRTFVGSEHIAWAWDISSAVADRRREIRILSCLVMESNRDRTFTFDEVLSLIFPLSRNKGLHPAIAPNYVLGTAVRAAFQCDNDHILRLCADGSLRTLPNTIIRRGPNGSPVIQWESIKAFLKARKI